MAERLVQRIYALMLTQPDKLWSYEELARRLNSRKKIICGRCLDLCNLGKIDKIMIESGKPRGRTARVFIKPPEIVYPSWLAPSRAAAKTDIEAVVSVRHKLDGD